MAHYPQAWTPADEVNFMHWLVRASVRAPEQPHQSIREKFTRHQRLMALENHLCLLPMRHFPGRSPAAVAAVITAGQRIYARAVKELEGMLGG